MNYTQSLSIGDLLTCTKLVGLITHRGAYVGHDAVLTNTPEKGEHLTSVSDFADGKAVEVCRTGANQVAVIQRVRKILANAKRFDPIKRNCEHTTYDAIEGVPKSPQVILWAVVALILLVCVWVRNR
jgi:hypothetical protein